MLKKQSIVDQFSENVRSCLLKPVEFETKNCFALKLIIISNRCSDYFRDSNLTTNEFDRFCSEIEVPGIQLIVADDSRFF